LFAYFQNYLTDNFKVRSSPHGNLYAYEIPSPQIVTVPAKSTDHTTPNGRVKHNIAKQEETRPSPALSHRSTNFGSSVHETNKRTVTNYSALHIKPSPSPNRAKAPSTDSTSTNSEDTDSSDQTSSSNSTSDSSSTEGSKECVPR